MSLWWMLLENIRVIFAFICFCSMIESAASENVVVVGVKILFYDDFHMRFFFLNFYARIVLKWFC